MRKKKKEFKMSSATQIPFWLLGGAIFTAILHNAFSAMFMVEEPIFITLTILLVIAFIAAVIFNILTYIKKGEPKDLWKLGWLGLFGLFGALAPGLYGFYGFFGFFGLRRK